MLNRRNSAAQSELFFTIATEKLGCLVERVSERRGPEKVISYIKSYGSDKALAGAQPAMASIAQRLYPSGTKSVVFTPESVALNKGLNIGHIAGLLVDRNAAGLVRSRLEAMAEPASFPTRSTLFAAIRQTPPEVVNRLAGPLASVYRPDNNPGVAEEFTDGAAFVLGCWHFAMTEGAAMQDEARRLRWLVRPKSVRGMLGLPPLE